MSENPTGIETELVAMPFFEFWKKFKRLKPFDSSLGVLGFCFASVCVLCCFFYLNSRGITERFKSPEHSEWFVWLNSVGSTQNQKVEFLGAEGSRCDIFDGDWVWDETYPLYQAKDCKFLDEGFRCSENGRPDLFYTKWRWQPKNCNLPRFDAKVMLERLRNKRVVFVGDSIGRNQWESLLCMLSSVVSNKDSIYEVNGSPITKHKGYLVFMFKDFNCTIEYYRAPFLVLQSRPPVGAPEKIKTTLKLDQMDWASARWRGADVLAFNTGHWWNYEKTIRGGCYFQEGEEVKMDMKVDDAYRMSMQTVMRWIHGELNLKRTRVFFRTYAPVHFRGGDWRNGGHCHLEVLPELGSSLVPPETWAKFNVVNAVLSAYSTPASQVKKFLVLNITTMTARRKDGHQSVYYLGPGVGPAPLHRQDCSHWCLPGVPDVWNELLYALFLKHEDASRWNPPTDH